VTVLIGVAIAVLGWAQFELAVALSQGPNPNFVVQEVVMWFSWILAIIIADTGFAQVVLGSLERLVENRRWLPP
jgi:hypothetical protein